MIKMYKFDPKFLLPLLMLAVFACSSPLESNKIHSIQEIKKYAQNGQQIKTKGTVTKRLEKKLFEISDERVSIRVDISGFKKEAKYLKEGRKVIITGIYTEKFLSAPLIKVKLLQVVDNFK